MLKYAYLSIYLHSSCAHHFMQYFKEGRMCFPRKFAFFLPRACRPAESRDSPSISLLEAAENPLFRLGWIPICDTIQNAHFAEVCLRLLPWRCDVSRDGPTLIARARISERDSHPNVRTRITLPGASRLYYFRGATLPPICTAEHKIIGVDLVPFRPNKRLGIIVPRSWQHRHRSLSSTQGPTSRGWV